MRLLNIHTLELEEFFDSNLPPYCILSHRWVGREITYKDFRKGRNKDSPGYQKILEFCRFVLTERLLISVEYTGEVAYQQPVEWVWIDTCCINKDSSAELSEAINSMFNYYLWARYCVVCLNDVPSGLNEEDTPEAFKKSSW